MKKYNIKLEGIKGTYYVISENYYLGRKYYLLESERYGEDIGHIVTDRNFKVRFKNVWDGWDEIDEYFNC